MKSAAIYKGKKKYIIHAFSKTGNGLRIAASPFFNLEIPVSASVIIYSLKQALDESIEGLPHPTNWKVFMKNYLDSTGLRNHKDLYKKFSFCSIQLNNNNYEIMPTINKGLEEGFIDLVDKKKEVPISSSEKVFFEALEAAFNLCE